MWVSFLKSFNGVSIASEWHHNYSNHLHLFSDASNWGFEVIFGSCWVQGMWPRDWRKHHINVREFIPIFLALTIWGHLWRDTSITFLCDNASVVQVINKACMKDPRMLCILRAITLLSLCFNCCIHAKHIPGKLNSAADSLPQIYSLASGFPILAFLLTHAHWQYIFVHTFYPYTHMGLLA